MVSFRFYLVSVIAVFLALAIGIGMGATVIDKATVDILNHNIKVAESHARAADQQHSVDSDALKQVSQFEDGAAATLVKGRLTKVPIVLVGVQGGPVEQDNVDKLHDVLVAAGADVEATLAMTAKWKLDKPADVTALANALDLSPLAPLDQVRGTAVTQLVASWTDDAVADRPLPTLVQLGFVQMKAGSVSDPAALPAPGTRVVVVSSIQPDVTADLLAIPLVQQLARALPFRVLAAEGGQDPDPASAPPKPAIREQFVGPLRGADLGVNGKIATVDNVDQPRGRIAVVYALQNLTQQKVGHYGVGAHADALFPPPQ